jgi:FkbM family methyltransferase
MPDTANQVRLDSGCRADTSCVCRISVDGKVLRLPDQEAIFLKPTLEALCPRLSPVTRPNGLLARYSPLVSTHIRRYGATMIRSLRRFIWLKFLRSIALQVLAHTGTFDVTWRRIRWLRDHGLEVHMAIDGGAAVGEWTSSFKKIYPEATVLCIEPRDNAQDSLARLARKYGDIHIAQTLVGDNKGETLFYEHADQSSVLKTAHGEAFGLPKRVSMTTLDALTSELRLPLPDLIKLDLQGFELSCLHGAEACLAHAQCVILEVSFIALYQDSPIIADIIAFMREKGFRCQDVLSLWHRPLDGALAFGDFVFLREGHPIMREGGWSKGKL